MKPGAPDPPDGVADTYIERCRVEKEVTNGNRVFDSKRIDCTEYDNRQELRKNNRSKFAHDSFI
jgi:hypothetical protein